MFIILLAAPSAGKGTLASKLQTTNGFVHISTGDLLRERRKINDEIGNIIGQAQDAGQLVSQDIVDKILIERLMEKDCDRGVILDGYPRSLDQAISLDVIVENINRKIDYVFYLNVDKEEVMRRALGRIVCIECGATYNTFNPKLKPQIDGQCDKCHHQLQNRSDDNEETVNKRYESFLNNTMPLIHYYKDKGLLFEVNANIDSDTTFENTQMIINGE